MTFWGKEREIAVRSHVPAQGRRTRVYISLLPEGERNKPTEQTLIAGGFRATVTLQGITVPSSGSNTYGVKIGTTNYSVSVSSGSSETVGSVARKLVKAINESNDYRAINYRKTGTGDAYRIFDVISTATFTIDNSPTTTGEASKVVVGTVNTTGSGAPAKGDTTINLPIPVRGKIPAGQWLQFVDPNGIEYLARLSQTANDGATSLAVAKLDSAIPAGSTAIFPVEFSDRREASINESYESSGFRTFNTGGFEDAIFTGASAEFSLGGLYNEFDAAYRTVAEFAPEGREFYAIVEYGNKRDGYTRPRKETIIMLSGQETPLSVDGLIEASFNAKVLQPPTTIFAALED